MHTLAKAEVSDLQIQLDDYLTQHLIHMNSFNAALLAGNNTSATANGNYELILHKYIKDRTKET